MLANQVLRRQAVMLIHYKIKFKNGMIVFPQKELSVEEMQMKNFSKYLIFADRDADILTLLFMTNGI